jgi:DNA (cytosine-5)-methyltransferase 1
MSQVPTVIDLFCGCGGISTGLLDAGYNVLAGFDNDRPSIEAFAYNHAHRGAKAVLADLATSSGKQLLDSVGVAAVDLVVGGPPCQAFSIAGKQRGLQDSRGNLIFDFVRIIEELQPAAFFFENVPNVERFDSGKLLRQLLTRLSRAGYGVSHAILFAPDYGVPQSRRRLVCVGIKNGKPLPMPPAPTHSDSQSEGLFGILPPYRVVSDALDDLPDVSLDWLQDIPNHEPTFHTRSMLDAFSNLAQGKRDKKSFHDRLHPDRPSYTLRAGAGNFSPLRPVHHRFDRVITVRESARLQGFADDFIWPDSLPRLQQYRQVGNAVPPLLAKSVGLHIAGAMQWDLQPSRFVGSTSSRAPHITKSPAERLQAAKFRTRGASLGGSV